MYKALVIKELRETGWIVLLAAGAFAFSFFNLIGYGLLTGSTERVTSIPFVDGQFLTTFEAIAAVFAIVLALRQSAWESLRGTSIYLLWRPITRGRVFAVKLIIGLALFLGTSGLALIVYALWAASPGKHASPFYWSMTIDSAVMWLAMTAVYLGAFVAGIRPGRIFGSRPLPLIAAIVPFALASAELSPLLRIAVVIVVDGLGLAAIHYVVRSRDYP
jgi:ABC-type transport system involved in multi-copper enzyme maturation permease subunit